ncbi:restriction endonuclease subunit S [Streptosporangium subroseum]|uniref:restriction endonuclease subunit S n=1 Tax=Streptosporangium subroseum TaxID=106412 RepID=UPI0030861479|nr:restriction endonuclease subunit S [Streptosporangium subroseum]
MKALIGDLPDGWHQVPLKEICDLVAGPSIPSAVSSGDFPVVKPRNVGDGRLVGVADGVEAEVAAELFRYRLMDGDVVCVRTGGLGRHALVTSEHEGWLFGTGMIRLRPGDQVNPRYFNHYLSHPLVQDWFKRNAAGSAIPSISGRALGTLPVAIPPIEIQVAIGNVLGALDEKIAVHHQIGQATAELRDALLPRLFGDPDGLTGLES